MTSGVDLFFRYARPPNELGYCGPETIAEVVAPSDDMSAHSDLARLAMQFEGAWPYLESIARQTRLAPLSAEVVESYWLGGDLLGEIDMQDWGNSVDERFRARAGVRWQALVEALNQGAVPNHAFHVFCVYPWVGLLREGFVDPALGVLDNCRISGGRVVRDAGDGRVVVSSRRLEWIDDRLLESAPTDGIFRTSIDLEPGDTVSLHWGDVCQRLDEHQSRALKRSHDRHLDIANTELRRARMEPAR